MSLKKPRSPISVFNLSFLDIMFCGFGAVVLLVLIVNSQMVSSRNQQHENLRARVAILTDEIEAEEKLIEKLENSLEELDTNATRLQGRSEIILSEIKRTTREIAEYRNISLAEKEHINKLASELKSTAEIRKRKLAQEKLDRNAGRKALKFTGQGHRQYLTGLRLGGKRVLILIDASASMLDSTIINILRRRNLPETERRDAPKWNRAKRTARWLLANLPLESKVRVATFNTDAHPLGDSRKIWVPVKDTGKLESILSDLMAVAPANGTNLYRAFSWAASLHPAPDNILLLTDGLPTMGASSPSGSKATSEQRTDYFLQAASRLPAGVPVNTILFPMEGDPMAASMYWKLAVRTRGSFLTPTRDWP